MIGTVAAITMPSTGRHGNLTLTDTVLRVGRAKVALAGVHPWGVSEPGARVAGRLIGGAYAERIGTHVVGLTMRNGTTHLVQSKDPDALRAALDDVLARFRAEVR